MFLSRNSLLVTGKFNISPVRGEPILEETLPSFTLELAPDLEHLQVSKIQHSIVFLFPSHFINKYRVRVIATKP